MAESYHHGALRAELVERAVDVIATDGPSDLSLRALARQAGVSHAAPAHHFATRTGLLTAVAAAGYRLLAAQLTSAAATGVFLEIGVAYVQFAVDHPAHFDVMFRRDLLHGDDPELVAAEQSAFGVLRSGVDSMAERGTVDDAAAAVVAGWSLVHGLAVLAATGSLDSAKLRQLLEERDLAAVTRRAAGMLFGSPGGPP